MCKVNTFGIDPPLPMDIRVALESARTLVEAFENLRDSIDSPQRFAHGDIQLLGEVVDVTWKAHRIACTIANAAQPINRLPIEILSVIFSLVPRPDRSVSSRRIFHRHQWLDLRDVCRLLATCRHWRQVGIGCPSLWTTLVDTRRRSPARWWFDRYKGGPLAVNLGYSPTEQTMALLCKHRSEVRALAASKLGSEALDTLTSASFPALQHCVLTDMAVGAERSFIHPSSQRLRTLELRSCGSLSPVLLPALTHLVIGEFTINTPAGAHQFSTFINGCPGLQMLCLDNIGLRDLTVTWDEQNGKAIRLPHLKVLCLNGRFYGLIGQHTVRALLSQLAIPDSCAVVLPSVMPQTLPLCLDILGLGGSSTTWRLLLTPQEVERPERQQQEASVEWHRSLRITRPGGRHIQAPVNVYGKSTLDILGDVRWLWVSPGTKGFFTKCQPHDPFRGTLGSLRNLQTLVICWDGDPGYLRATTAVIQSLDIPTGAAQSDVCCPALKTLRMDITSPAEEQQILTIARSRAAAGYPLARVIVGSWSDSGANSSRTDETYVLREYDGSGALVRVGDGLSDGLKAHWLSQISDFCLDKTQECPPYWSCWRWDGAR
ncbi:hypothetical protein C8Q76DRAFT_801822 [Earliella scabrosa]|nr:hypothetical protein C8Q76DRAFT_801822 [Earliella scabrosa]